MIRILITGDWSSKTIDRLNEIPEFEIIEKANTTREKLFAEIKNMDAVIVRGASPLTPAMLKDAANLKIIVLTGKGSSHEDTVLAGRNKIEIRHTPPGENQEQEGLDVIAILKDFFNV